MDLEKARKILEEDNGLDLPKNRTAKGIILLSKFDESMEYCFEHDQMWVCDFESTTTKMSEEEVRQMHQWGWFESEESWSHF